MKSSPLHHRLSTADRSWRQSRASELFFKLIPAFCLLIALATAADMTFHLGNALRLSISLALVLGVVLLISWLFYRAWIKSGSLLPIARLLEDRDPDLGSRLINVLQLQAKAEDPDLPQLTRTLAKRAVNEASQELEDRDFCPLTQSPTIKRTVKIALTPIAILLILVFCFSTIASSEWLRFADPYGDHPPFAFTQLTIVSPSEEGTRVVYGQPSLIEVKFSGHHPKELFLTSIPTDTDGNGKSEEVTIPLFPQGEQLFVQQIDSVESDLTIHAHNRSNRALSHSRQIKVILNPEVEKSSVSISPPAYTLSRNKKLTLKLNAKKTPTVTALIGSDLVFTIQSNRPLSTGSLSLRTSAPEAQQTPLTQSAGELDHTATANLKASESGLLYFDLRDQSGLSSRQKLTANLIVTHDLPPNAEIIEPRADGFVVENFEAKVIFRGSDDYGLRRMRLHIGINDHFAPPRIIEAHSSTAQREMTESLTFTPSQLGAKNGDIITLFADLTDIKPEAQSSRTRSLKLEVISENDYNDYLRRKTEIRDLENKYATLHDQLRDLAKKQRALAEKVKSSHNKETSQQQRDRLAAQQQQLNTELIQLAEKMESATRDNPLYDLENELQKVLNKEAETIRNSVTQNKKDLAKFINEEPSPPSMQAFAQDAKKQADRLDPALEQAEKKIADAIEDAAKMQDLLKALAAYQALYQSQQQIASQSAAFRDKTELSHEDKLALQDMAGSERFIGKGLREIVAALRKGAEAAKQMYPLAAGDAEDIADAIEQANLSTLADKSSHTMLSGKGPKSHQQAEHLRDEMAKLISDCQSCNNNGRSELSQRLSLMRSMMAGNTFSQMAQCQKFGFGSQSGTGMGMGRGMGMTGFEGNNNSQMGQASPSLLGGESNLGQRSSPHSGAQDGGDGRGTDENTPVVVRKANGKKTTGKSSPRTATSLTGDLFTDEYRELVEAYFRKLTKKTTP